MIKITDQLSIKYTYLSDLEYQTLSLKLGTLIIDVYQDIALKFWFPTKKENNILCIDEEYIVVHMNKNSNLLLPEEIKPLILRHLNLFSFT
jgi:hypothetical protein